MSMRKMETMKLKRKRDKETSRTGSLSVGCAKSRAISSLVSYAMK
jgi:hypothetical protein